MESSISWTQSICQHSKTHQMLNNTSRRNFHTVAVYGPYHEKPFSMHVSPLMVRDKPNSNKNRTIMDLSWLFGFSFNHGVSKSSYLNTYFTLHYPSVDHITQVISSLGPRCPPLHNQYQQDLPSYQNRPRQSRSPRFSP